MKVIGFARSTRLSQRRPRPTAALYCSLSTLMARWRASVSMSLKPTCVHARHHLLTCPICPLGESSCAISGIMRAAKDM